MKHYTNEELVTKLVNQLEMELHSYEKSSSSMIRNISKMDNGEIKYDEKRYDTMKLNLQESIFLINWTKKQIENLVK